MSRRVGPAVEHDQQDHDAQGRQTEGMLAKEGLRFPALLHWATLLDSPGLQTAAVAFDSASQFPMRLIFAEGDDNRIRGTGRSWRYS